MVGVFGVVWIVGDGEVVVWGSIGYMVEASMEVHDGVGLCSDRL